MTICDLNSGAGQLKEAFGQLKERWAAVQSQWRDDAGRDFEQMHLREIPARLQLMMTAVQRLSEALAQAERDCRDRDDEGLG